MVVVAAVAVCVWRLDNDVMTAPCQMETPTRVASFFVYLNTLAEGAGGKTMFPFPCPSIGIRSEASLAVLWSNVVPINDAMPIRGTLSRYEPDPRTIHCGEVIKEDVIKYGFNICVCIVIVRERGSAMPRMCVARVSILMAPAGYVRMV